LDIRLAKSAEKGLSRCVGSVLAPARRAKRQSGGGPRGHDGEDSLLGGKDSSSVVMKGHNKRNALHPAPLDLSTTFRIVQIVF